VNVSVSPSLQNKTVSPTTAQQTISADSGYDGLSSVTVNAISPTKVAATYTPTTTDQSIASGQWLTGAQTILGDANLTAENIKKDVSIFNVTGTYEGGGGSVPLTNVTISNSDYTSMRYTDSSMQVQTMTIDSESAYNLSLPSNTLVAFYASQTPMPGPMPPSYLNLTLWHTATNSRSGAKLAVYVVNSAS
jgi:hypothetical protein